jgi:hypothetical protein
VLNFQMSENKCTITFSLAQNVVHDIVRPAQGRTVTVTVTDSQSKSASAGSEPQQESNNVSNTTTKSQKKIVQSSILSYARVTSRKRHFERTKVDTSSSQHGTQPLQHTHNTVSHTLSDEQPEHIIQPLDYNKDHYNDQQYMSVTSPSLKKSTRLILRISESDEPRLPNGSDTVTMSCDSRISTPQSLSQSQLQSQLQSQTDPQLHTSQTILLPEEESLKLMLPIVKLKRSSESDSEMSTSTNSAAPSASDSASGSDSDGAARLSIVCDSVQTSIDSSSNADAQLLQSPPGPPHPPSPPGPLIPSGPGSDPRLATVLDSAPGPGPGPVAGYEFECSESKAVVQPPPRKRLCPDTIASMNSLVAESQEAVNLLDALQTSNVTMQMKQQAKPDLHDRSLCTSCRVPITHSAGCTFVPPSESKQLGVRDKFEQLPPVGFQTQRYRTVDRTLCQPSEFAVLTRHQLHQHHDQPDVAYVLLPAETEVLLRFIAYPHSRTDLLRQYNARVYRTNSVLRAVTMVRSNMTVVILLQSVQNTSPSAESDEATFTIRRFMGNDTNTAEANVFITLRGKLGVGGTYGTRNRRQQSRQNNDNISDNVDNQLVIQSMDGDGITEQKDNSTTSAASATASGTARGGPTQTVSVRIEVYVTSATWSSWTTTMRNNIHDLARLLEFDFCHVFAWLNSGHNHRTHARVLRCVEAQQLLVHFARIKPTRVKQVNPRKSPFYPIKTRDDIQYRLVPVRSKLRLADGREAERTWYRFPSWKDSPPAFQAFQHARRRKLVGAVSACTDLSWRRDPQWLRVGMVLYTDVYGEATLVAIENHADETDRAFVSGKFLPFTGQRTIQRGRTTRTKFFFNARYLWHKTQLSGNAGRVANGVRSDVSHQPDWMPSTVLKPLIEEEIVPSHDFVNSFALNIYHDGSEGIAQHFDDFGRFDRPVITLRLFSDSRLAFGSQYFGMVNTPFFVPLPRGAIAVMERDSFAADGIKHCVRPYDLVGKSAAVIMRRIHPHALRESERHTARIALRLLEKFSLRSDEPVFGPTTSHLHRKYFGSNDADIVGELDLKDDSNSNWASNAGPQAAWAKRKNLVPLYQQLRALIKQIQDVRYNFREELLCQQYSKLQNVLQCIQMVRQSRQRQ